MNGADLQSVRAVYMRGGTSRALIFHRADLPTLDSPADVHRWDPLFLSAMGSPDPHGRQLDGMGGGISSLSKVAVVSRSTRPDADVDYTFGQVVIGAAHVGYKGNCGNISAAIGPFAVDEGLVCTTGPTATVRIHNTNTGKIIVASFPLAGGKAAVHGDFTIEGVAGSGAPVRLAFLDPGGSVTGKLFPSGKIVQALQVPGGPALTVSLVDAANPVVFAEAQSLGLDGSESVAAMSADSGLMARLQGLRVAAALEMGVAPTESEARTTVANLPLVALLIPTRSTGAGDSTADIGVRMVSADLPHKATPLTGALCLAVAARIEGTLVHRMIRPNIDASSDLNLAHISGTLRLSAEVIDRGLESTVVSAVMYRTARRLMDGRVYVVPP